MNRNPRNGLLLAASFAICLSGCGKKLTDVSGTVLYKDKPLPFANISFVDESSGRAAAGRIQDGKFTVPRVPVGDKITVIVVTTTASAQLQRSIETEGRKTLVSDLEPPRDGFTEDKAPEEWKDRTPQWRDMPQPRTRDQGGRQQKDKPDERILEQFKKLGELKELRERLIHVPARYESIEATPLSVKISGDQKNHPLAIIIED